MANSVDPDQTAPICAVCSGSMLFASMLNSSVMLGNDLQQTTFSGAFLFLTLEVLRGHMLNVQSSIVFFSLNIDFVLTNSEDPDEI